ncbi:MAG: MATE family efflux transporter [Lachnospiraceae bacterium]|nr:MATE family efflux transporter [Lachnospiraceae bacterium]
MQQKSSHEIDMLHGPVLPAYFAFTIPMALSMLLQLLFNAADVIVVGRFAGANALAAVGSTTSLVALMINIISGLSTGVNTIIARDYARDCFDKVSNAVHTSLPFGFLGGLAVALLAIPAAHPILTLMQSPPEVIGMSVIYLRIYFISLPMIALYNFGAAILRSIGDTRRPMLYLLFSGIVNLLLNLYMVIVLRLGVIGVGVATAVSNTISAFLVLGALLREDSCLRFRPSQMAFLPNTLREILHFGLPASIQGSLFAFSNILIQSSVNSFGSVYMAGNAAAQSVEGFQYAFLMANMSATLTFMSQHIGAGLYERSRIVLRTIITAGMVITTLIGIVFAFFRVPLLTLYNPDPAVLGVAMRRMTILVLIAALEIPMDSYSNAIRAAGRTIEPTVISLIGACGFRVLWLMTVFRIFHYYETIFMVWPVSWVLTGLADIVFYKRIMKSHFKPAQ